MTDKTHVHKLKRIAYKSGNTTFFCVLDCKFKITPPLALGKKCICWRCGNEFIMNEYSIRLVKPHCEACHKPKKNEIQSDTSIESKEENKEESREESEELTLASRLQQAIKTTITEKEIEEEEL